MGDFIHLHNHSHYSLQDAACTVESLVGCAKEMDMHAIALTDHGVMFGVSELYYKAKKAGIKPILGMEAYIVFNGTRFDKAVSQDGVKKRVKLYNHLVLLAKNEIGYKNLIKLTSIGHTEGFYYKPRIDLEVLRKYKEGLICTTACPAGPVSSFLIDNDFDKAYEAAKTLKDIFGDDLYLEIQDHGIDIEQPVLEGMPKIAKMLNTKIIATNDIHYIKQEHSLAHNILLLLSDKTGNADYKTLRYSTDQVYFKSTEEMKKLFKRFPGAIENTLEIEAKINVNLDNKENHFPVFPIPPESKAKTLDEYFEMLAREGLAKRFKKTNREIEDRFDFEIDVIKKMGYSGYFLVVQDFINASKKRGIPVGPGRGSAAGSLVAYALSITNVNPLDYALLFERFLNPARKTMPDIDVDFADDQRGEVIEYVKEKYGEKSVCQIITFNRLSSKAVLRDVARVLKIPIPTVNSITKWIPSKFGKVFTIDQAIDEVPELKWVKESKDPVIQELIKYSRILEGMNRNASTHAAGVVIAPGEVSDYIPLAVYGDSGDVVSQYNMKELESAGLLKMDFLGLRTLSIIRDTIELIKKTRGIDVNIDEIPLNDKKTFELFAHGQTTAVFQFESAPMREYLKKLVPTTILDLTAMNALYRPGPMEFIDDFISRKHGKTKIIYQHPVLEEILKETNGIIVYQEQVIQIANKVAGMSLAEADLLRRAMGKKDLKAMAEQKEKFVKGAVEKKIPEKIAIEIFDSIDKFANYGFNKSHAVAYSLVAYQTAYLKAHYLEEFLAANLSNEYGNPDKVTILLEDCRKMKVKVLPPDINDPSIKFSVDRGRIVFGMAAIKNVGINAVAEIKNAHDRVNRKFKSIYDFCSCMDTRVVNKRVLEGLVLAGAFDSIAGSRSQNFAAIEEALSFGSKLQGVKNAQEGGLFADDHEAIEIHEPALPNVNAWDSKERLSKERQVLGFYLSDHPLRKYEAEYYSFANVYLGEQETYKLNEIVRACGVITDIRTRIDKAGRQMAFFKLDDFSGSCECITFSKVYKEYENIIEDEATVIVRGMLESSGDAVKLNVEDIIPLAEAKTKLTRRLGLVVDGKIHGEKTIAELKSILENNNGSIPVSMRIMNGKGYRDFYLSYKVNPSEEAIAKIIKLLGEDSIRYFTG